MGLEEQIAAVDWESLHHAYGAATDVPDLLRTLMWPEQASPALREAAQKRQRSVFDHVTWTLWGNVFHQGTVWQVTATTVPLFVEILRSGPDNAELKAFLITYLHHLATGYPDDMFPDGINPETDFVEAEGKTDPGGEPDYGVDDNRPLIWMRDSYEAVERHVEDVLPFLESVERTVAEAAIALCASFTRRAEISVPPLRMVAAQEDRLGANAAISLAALNAPDLAEVTGPLIGSGDLATSVLGACAEVIHDPGAASPEAVAALLTPLGDDTDMDQPHAGTVRALVGRCLVLLGPDHRDRAVARICDQLEEAPVMDNLALTQSLLRIAFPEMPAPDRTADLSNLQRKAMETIRDHGAFRVSGGLFSNYASLLQAWSLPSSAADIDRWLRI